MQSSAKQTYFLRTKPTLIGNFPTGKGRGIFKTITFPTFSAQPLLEKAYAMDPTLNQFRRSQPKLFLKTLRKIRGIGKPRLESHFCNIICLL